MPTTTDAAPSSPVTTVPAARAADAHAHFAARLAVETDCADVAADLAAGAVPYTILDVRSERSFAAGHLPGARSVPSATIDHDVATSLPDGLLVVYCWGPGCNGAHKAGLALTRHGRQVKEMLGGFEYWVREGQPVEGERADELAALAEPRLVG